MITAKPIVKDKFWILREDDKKVGTVEQVRNKFILHYGDQQAEFKTIRTLKSRTNIFFEESKERAVESEYQVHGFATDVKPFNSVYDVQLRLPLYTKKNKSKSWHAAGYYQIDVNGQVELHFCPKLILLQRYKYMGPVHGPSDFVFK